MTLQIFDGKYFDRWLNVFHHIRCIVFKQFDGLNFDSLAGKHQERQNPPHQNFVLYGILKGILIDITNNPFTSERSIRVTCIYVCLYVFI